MSEYTREEFKAKWIAALRSGEYKKGTEAYYYDGCHCTMGVAVSLISGRNEFDDGALDKLCELFPEIEPGGGGIWGDIANLNDYGNDDGPLTFEQMADYLEQKL